jgi:uncharacterized protein (DUF427 family)
MSQDHSTTLTRPSFKLPPAYVEPTARWIRVKFGGAVIADSKRALLLAQYGPGPFPGNLPTYYFPQDDVHMEALAPSAEQGRRAAVSYQTVRIGERVAERGAWIVQSPPPEFASLQHMVSFHWERMDGWYEEEEEIFVHARDPHKRVDVLASSRHVRVSIAGVTIAETRRPYLLFETPLPARYYIPREDVRADLLTPTDHTSRCPYKGIAQYWSVTAGGRTYENIVWSYPDPIVENPKIKGLLCFFNEQVDLLVDGVLQPRPLTPWSKGAEEQFDHLQPEA